MSGSQWLWMLGSMAFVAVAYYFSMRSYNKDVAKEDWIVKDDLDENDYEVK